MSLVGDIWHFYISVLSRIIGGVWGYCYHQYNLHLRSWVDDHLQQLGPYFEISKEILLHSIIIFVLASLCLYISAFLFGALYFYNMPTIYHSFDLDLQYSRKCIEQHRNYLRTGNAVSSMYQDSCFPKAIVDFDSPDNQRILEHDQTYQIYLRIDLPESPQNLDIGMFMVNMKCGKLTSSKPVSIKFKPFLIRLLSTAVYWPLLLFSVLEAKQTLTIPLFQEVILDYPTKDEIKTCRWQEKFEDLTKCEHRFGEVTIDYPDIQIYSAQLQISATFLGLQYYLYQWPVFSFLVGTSIFFVPVLASFLVVFYLIVWKTSGNVQQTTITNDHGDNRRRGRRLNRGPDPVEALLNLELMNETRDDHEDEDPPDRENDEDDTHRSTSSSTASSIEMIGSPIVVSEALQSSMQSDQTNSQEQPTTSHVENLDGEESVVYYEKDSQEQ